MLRWRSLALTALLAPVLASAALAQTQLPRRLTIPTVIVTSTPAAQADLRSWKDLLQTDMAMMAMQLSWLPNAARITIQERPAASAPTLSAIDERWRRENAIQVVTAVGSRAGNVTTMEGNIYIGAIDGSQPRMLSLPSTVDGAAYRRARSLVQLSALYALSVDAGANRAAGCRLLFEAGQAQADLVRSGGVPTDIAGAIAQRRSTLKCGTR